MAERNCKKCVNGDICLSMYHNPVAEHCSFYKDKKEFVNVVRCEDCEYRIKDDVGRYFCELGDFYVGETDYCSRGKRTPKERVVKKYYSPEEVRKMTPQEVKANYQAIMESMKGGE